MRQYPKTQISPMQSKGDICHIINLFNTGIGYFLFAYKTCLLYVHQRNDMKSRVSVLMHILTSFLQISILLTTKNYYVYVCVTLITMVSPK